MSPPEPAASDLSTPQLLTRLSEQTSRLVRDELRLARRELVDSATHAGKGAGLLSGAALLALLGLLSLVAAAIAGLALILPVWAAAAIVAAVLFVGAAIAALISKGQLQQASPTPDQTIENVKDDLQEVKDARHAH